MRFAINPQPSGFRQFVLAALMCAGLAWGAASSAQVVVVDATRGQALYGTWCAACHGGDPASGSMRVQLSTSAAMVQTAITTVPSMSPIGGNLTSAQMADIAAFVAQRVSVSTTAGAISGGTSATATGAGAVSSTGAMLYAQACAVCHGSSPARGSMRVQLGTSLAALQNAISVFPAMRGLTLSSTQLTDVATYIAADVASGGMVGSTTSIAVSPVERGKSAYAAMCASCHGADPARGRADINEATSAAAIQRAIVRKSVMRYLAPTVTDAIAADVASYVVASQTGSSATSADSHDGSFDEGDENAGRNGNQQFAGGCTLGRFDQPATDPIWLLMLAGAAFALIRRSKAAQHMSKS